MNSFTSMEGDISSSLGLTNNTLSLGGTITFIFVLLVMSALLVGGLRLAVAGFYKAEGTPASLAKFKDTLRRISVALIIILPVALIFSLLNKDFLVGDIGLDQFKINKVNRSEPVPVSKDQVTPQVSTIVGGKDGEYRKRLVDAGVQVLGNVSFEGINPASVDLLVRLKEECRCSVVVTSAVRTGDPASNHMPGRGAIDLGINGDLTNFLKKNGSSVSRGGCNEKDSWGGYIFWYEWNIDTNSKCSKDATGPHYHVSFNGW